jgi:2-hydroxy-3-keto-5-methylthiopentenyl-1-phosphate phosphatase
VTARRASWAVVCDFDGTATIDDLADALSIAYIGEGRWRDANDRFHRGEIPFVTLLHEIFGPIGATPAEVRAFAHRHARFRPGFERLVRACREGGHPFVIASGGLDIYIRPALELLPHDVSHGLEVRANRAEHVAGGLALQFPWQHAPGACGQCGSCKGAIVKELQARGHRVIAVGDGNADRCMAGVADVLFARGRLLEWCRREGFACEEFDALDPVVERLRACAAGADGIERVAS